MANTYHVTLVPLSAGKDGPTDIEIVEIPDVDMAYNGAGWLVFTNDRRQTVAAFAPGFVMFVIIKDLVTPIIEIEATDPALKSVN